MSSSSRATGSIRGWILKLTAFFGILLLCFLLFIATIFYAKKVWILEQFQSYVAKAQSGELKIDNMELALFKHLPNVTIKLSEIRYYEHRGDRRGNDELPIVSARDLYVAFEPWQLLRYGKLVVSEVSVGEGTINLVQYTDNVFNLEHALAPPGFSDSLSSNDEKGLSTVTLHSVEMNNILFSYRDLAEKQSAEAILTYLDGEISLNETGIDLALLSDFQIISSSSRSSLELLGPVGIDVNLSLARSSKQIVLHSGLMTVGDVELKMNGTYDHFDDQKIDMHLDGSSSGFKLLAKMVHEDVVKRNKSRLEAASVVLKGRVHGKVRHRAPLIDVTFAVKNVNLQLIEQIGDFRDIGFEGEFHTGFATDFSEASLMIKNLKGAIPGGKVSGHFMCNNFQEPYLNYDLDLDLLLDGYDKVFRIPEIEALTGKVALKAKFDGPLELRKQLNIDSLSAWSLVIDNVGFVFLPTDKKVVGLSGKITERGNEVLLTDLSIDYDSSSLLVSGVVRNLYHFLFDKGTGIEASLSVKADRLYTKDLLRNPENRPMVSDRITNLKFEANIARDSANVTDSAARFQVAVDHMSFEMDELPGVRNLSAAGVLHKLENELLVDFHDFHAEMPHGVIDISGNLRAPMNTKTIDIEAKVAMKDFPWTYVVDLVNEMQGKELIGSKYLEPADMEIWNGELDLLTTFDPSPFALNSLDLRKSRLTMHRLDSQFFEFNNVNLQLRDLHFDHDLESSRIVGVHSGSCNVTVSSLMVSGIRKSDVDLKIDVIKDKYNAVFTMLSQLADSEKGSLLWDRTTELSTFKVNYVAKGVPIESIVNEYYPNKLAEGNLDISVALRGDGIDWSAIKGNVNGTIALEGDSIVLYGIDIDDVLKKFEKSQKFNLVDVGAVLLAGPLGVVITKGTDFGKLAAINLDTTKRTSVTDLVAKWKIYNGTIETDDVALSTTLNRLACIGKVDFVNDTIPGYTVYVLDKNGCSLMDQRIYGKVNNIQVGKLNIAKTLFGSVINFVNAMVGKDCKPVYVGSMKHPT